MGVLAATLDKYMSLCKIRINTMFITQEEGRKRARIRKTHLKSILSRKAFVTVVAGEWLNSQVNALMSF